MSGNQRALYILAGTAAAASLLALGYQSWYGSRKRSLLRQLRKCMLLDEEGLIQVRDDFCSQMAAGLNAEPSSLLMIPSMVDIIPSGNERGKYLALDLGGTNFRCVYIKLGDGKGQIDDVKIQQCEIPEHHFTSPAEDLFIFMAERMVAFATDLGFARPRAADGQLPVVGFCFSFPCEHVALNAGKLIRWTKKFNNPGAVGQDPVRMLEKAFEKIDFPVDVDCMVNDTVGVLAAARYVDSSVMIGMILGTGTNACYVEKIDNVRKLPQTPRRRRQTMIINIEWGSFASDTMPRLEFDRDLDTKSANPGAMQLEKLTSGMYLGEITQRILLKFARETGLFGGPTPLLQSIGRLTTPDTSKIDHDDSFMGGPTADILYSTLGLTHWQTIWDRQLVRDIVRLVAQRSSQLIAAGIAALLRQMERDGTFGPMQRTVVAVDGGMFQHYRAFRDELLSALERIMGAEAAHQIVMKHQKDGSSMGAVTMAGAAAPSQRRSEAG